MTKIQPDLDRALIEKLANGSGRCYPHEGKYMAQEILRRREAEEKLTKTQPIGGPPPLIYHP